MNKEFWKSWKKKSELEKKAIESLILGRKIILKSIPGKEIVAIYIKGSFIRRELNEKSDVDFVTILRTGRYIPKLRILENKYKEKIKPVIQIRPAYSLRELKTGKRIRKTESTPPNRFAKHLGEYKLIYGTALDEKDLFMRSDEEDLKSLAEVLLNKFIPEFEKREAGNREIKSIGLSGVIKQVFWVTELEQKINGIRFEHSFKAIKNSVKNRKHVIHEAYELRIHPTKDKKKRIEFIHKLKIYLGKMQKPKAI